MLKWKFSHVFRIFEVNGNSDMNHINRTVMGNQNCTTYQNSIIANGPKGKRNELATLSNVLAKAIMFCI